MKKYLIETLHANKELSFSDLQINQFGNVSVRNKNFCFIKPSGANLEKLNYKDVKSFNAQYSITEQMFNEFVENASKNHGVTKDLFGINASKNRIKNQLKSELATYLWDEEARFFISIPFDNDIQIAIKALNNKIN